MTSNALDFSTASLKLAFSVDPSRLTLASYGSQGKSWLHPASAAQLFALTVDGKKVDGSTLAYSGYEEDTTAPGVRHLTFSFLDGGIRAVQHIQLYEDSALLETWTVVTNTSPRTSVVERIASLSIDLAADAYRLKYFTGNWGSEFEPYDIALEGPVRLESRSGRSTKGNHPWFALTRPDGEVLSAAVVWSGNWVLRFDPLPAGGWRLSGGLNDWSFSKELRAGESMESPHVVLVVGASLNAISQQYAKIGRKYWYPRNALSERQPVEWNHWWPYEDVEINEEVFLQNVEVAAKMGMEVCTLDAGWFGPSDPGTHWYEYRGDWHLVNDQRFPHGIRPLADRTHELGMRFGIWCEIEGLGINASLAKEHPAYVALRGGERLGYVCFGNPDVQEWAYQTLTRLIRAYDADWIKLDFNLDPGAGCDRADHGHGAGEGLYAHYLGYYKTLERVRADYPNVVLENCSSGGLRIDLGILRQTHMTFLSDPDWPVHDLQIFWGASTMLAPDVLLHWSFCEWRNTNPPPQQTFNPRDPKLTRHQLDYYTRISMLGLYGLSQKLPDLPEWVADRLNTHTRIYQEHVRRFVREADLHRLTDQPLRSGAGERWSAFQYSLPDGTEHLLFVFRLPGAEAERSILLEDLEPDRSYSVTGFEDETAIQRTGRELMETGIRFTNLQEEDSALLRLA